MNFKKIDKKYRPIPFWSWNEKLDVEETVRQVGVMDEAGIGGYFMHARGGLLTDYMGKEWFDNVKAASNEGNSRGMYPWAYDENGWPSGFGGGKVNGLGVEYQQKYLNMEPLTEDNENAENTVAKIGGYRYYYEVNEFYVDVLSHDVIAKFIEEIYEEYDKQMKGTFSGFFTDEPQITREGSYPWSFTLPKKFSEKYGYDLVSRLNELFFDEGEYERTRVDFWHLVTELFSENYFKQIYDWCVSHGYGFTGHLVCEESYRSLIRSNGATMPHYEYFTIPGMDWLGRPIKDCLTPTALGSAAAQLGKNQVLSETFALAGHNVSHGELKRIYEWQMVRGVNLLCTHLEGYSLRGIRKRDYPPAMYYQQPWWPDMKIFFDSMSRVGMILAEGKISADTLLIEPVSTAWKLYRGNISQTAEEIKRMDKYNASLIKDVKKLERKHILFHFGDEILMERHGSVVDGELIIGNMRYKRVIIGENLGLLPNTEKLLDEFKRSGGIITTADEIAPNPITEENSLTYTKRQFEDFDVHYFVNSTNENVYATFTRGNLILDIETGETKAFYGSHKFVPTESIVLIDTHDPRERMTEAKKTTQLSLLGEWTLKSATYNSITLDKCDYYFDGELVAKGGYVLDIIPRLNEKRRAVKLTQVYEFETECAPEVIFLCIETPEIFDITLNGKQISSVPVGDFRDKSFKLLDIKDAVRVGRNEIVINSTIRQSDETYDHLSKSWAFESMKNSLSYDMEIEPIYIVGDFSASLPSAPEAIDGTLYKIDTTPVITEKRKTVIAEKLDESGFPEFAGELVLEREIELTDTNKYVTLVGAGMNSVSISVNGKKVATKIFAPNDVDISNYLTVGKNTLEVRILNNLRNMQGPLHLNKDDNAGIGPRSFFRESNVFCHANGKGEDCHDVLVDYIDEIRLVRFGLRDK
ncbi:MAG: hypothetical protein IJY23_06440 [Clostridia bacterium]|nr:hypothetical protein [Clostridia bacterium]